MERLTQGILLHSLADSFDKLFEFNDTCGHHCARVLGNGKKLGVALSDAFLVPIRREEEEEREPVMETVSRPVTVSKGETEKPQLDSRPDLLVRFSAETVATGKWLVSSKLK